MRFELKAYQEPDFTQPTLQHAPDASWVKASRDFTAPENYHATTIFPEYFKVNGQWILAKESRMDCVAVLEGDTIAIREFRHIKAGDLVCVGRTDDGRDGIYVHTGAFPDRFVQDEAFAFRKGRSRETAFSMDYDFIYELLKHERDHGNIVWVLGPACSFDADSRHAFERLIEAGYAHAILAGNALATHDLEGAYKKTALGQDIYTQEIRPNGHYHHIDTINRVRSYGSIPAFIRGEDLSGGIICSCVEHRVPFVLVGSIRDDGPLPEVYGDVYAGQDAMRDCLRKATTVICMATTLHSIAAGNMTPSFRVMPDGTIRQVYFYCVDVSEFSVNKLGDRGSLSARGIVTNVQDFIVNIRKGLGL